MEEKGWAEIHTTDSCSPPLRSEWSCRCLQNTNMYSQADDVELSPLLSDVLLLFIRNQKQLSLSVPVRAEHSSMLMES